MWKALDFLVVCGKWSKAELVDIALQTETVDGLRLVSGLLPKAQGQPGPVSMIELKMLESPRVDPALISPIQTDKEKPSLSLDDRLHNVVTILYRDLQKRLD